MPHRPPASLVETEAPPTHTGATILPFESQAQRLHRRGLRNRGRWLMKTHGHVPFDSAEVKEWEAECAAERRADLEWAERHGPSDEGARVLRFSPSQPFADVPPERSTAIVSEVR